MNLQKIVTGMLGLFFAKKGIKALAKKKALNNPKIQQRLKSITAEFEQLNKELEQD
jgi:hypothetical protein